MYRGLLLTSQLHFSFEIFSFGPARLPTSRPRPQNFWPPLLAPASQAKPNPSLHRRPRVRHCAGPATTFLRSSSHSSRPPCSWCGSCSPSATQRRETGRRHRGPRDGGGVVMRFSVSRVALRVFDSESRLEAARSERLWWEASR
jgi:hypothetical protein